MFKKMAVLLLIAGLVLGYFQLYTARDFGQLGLVWSKYTKAGNLNQLFDDISIVFAGGRVKEPTISNSKYSDKVVYRWKDKSGLVHVSEAKPAVDNYETIRVGDLKITTQKGLTKEEIDSALQQED